MADDKRDPTPAMGKRSFACPYTSCGVYAEQKWYRPWLDEYRPDPLELDPNPVQTRKLLELFSGGSGYLSPGQKPQACFQFVEGASVSVCNACSRATFWLAEKIIYPVQKTSLRPHADMPDDIIIDFREAASIVDDSPRGACALLRLCVQKLCMHFGYPGKDLNQDIGKMVAEKGLSPMVQQAYDVVRVVGNSAVHPLELNIKDNREIALTLFKIVNMIVEKMIADPKHLNSLFSDLPTGVREGIARRDAPK